MLAEPDREQRRYRHREDHREHRPGRADHRSPDQSARGQLGAAHPDRPQCAVAGRFQQAQPDQQLAEHEQAEHSQQSGEEPQCGCLQADRTLSVDRLRAERVVADRLAATEAADLPLDNRHIRAAMAQPQRNVGGT